MTKLSLANLRHLADKASVPNYRREDLTAGILHFGVGNFHRAHLAVYLHDLFSQGKNLDFAIIGAGVMASDGKMKEVLKAQDYLTTVVEQDISKSAATITGPMIDFIAAPDFDAIIDKLADPAIRIVSMTITEGGYFIDLVTPPGKAKKTIALAKEAGITLTPAGAAFPYGKDPTDSHIRIAPSFPSLDEITQAAHGIALALLVASGE